MNLFELIKRDIFHYRRPLLATVLLAMVCSMILTGALLVGDSVQHTLKKMAEMRLGRTRYVMSTGDRYFRLLLSDEIVGNTEANIGAVPVLAVKGILESPDGSVRINNLNVYGVESSFWQLAESTGQSFASALKEGVRISESVKARLDSTDGDFLLRLQQPTVLSQDLLFSAEGGDSQAWAIKIAEVVPDEAMGRFSLQASQVPPLNVFVPIEWLAEKMGQPDKANLLLVANGWASLDDLQNRLKDVIGPGDAELKFRTIESEKAIELRTPRIFLDKSIADAALQTGTGAYGVFTHLVNEIRFGQKAVPYSTVTGMGAGPQQSLSEDQIIINEWLAYELGADVDDQIELTYFKLTDTRRLVEETTRFTVVQVVPMMGSYADATLMPDYPGISEAESCRQWDSGMPIDLDKIRSQDETYWDQYKGTPKAYVSLAAATKLWANRFGTLTAVRWPAKQNTLADLQTSLMQHVNLQDIGFAFRDVKTPAQTSARGSTDFSGLFAGLSMFLIFAAAILLSLAFTFYIESRSQHIGLLKALGWNRLRIFMFFSAEGSVLAGVGCVVGTLFSVVYTGSMIAVLNTTFWSKALASLRVDFGLSAMTLIEGTIISFLICMFAMKIALYRCLRKPAHQLLAGVQEDSYKPQKRRFSIVHILGWLFLAGGVFLSLGSGKSQQQVAAFFTAGFLCLSGVLMVVAHWLGWLRQKSTSFARSLEWVAVKNVPRRISRAVAVLIALSCGIFLVVSVGANYKPTDTDVHNRRSGTGGFALLAQTTLPMTQTPTLPGDSETQISAIHVDDVVMMRIYEQDDASCLNLNRAQNPTLLGVDIDTMAAKNPFTFQLIELNDSSKSPWTILAENSGEDIIPAVGDYATVYWGLGKKLGDILDYTDEKGRSVKLQIAGILKESVLQGRLLISEDNFVRLFPSVDGYSIFLIDADAKDLHLQAKELNKRYRDVGMETVPTARILEQLNEVENTYLMIFLVLGGLGLILGSLGLGFVLVLNVLDRRGELAMMQAIGFRLTDLRYMLLFEHGLLLAGGILCGLIPGLWAVVPTILSQNGAFPIVSIVLVIIAMLVCGGLWIVGAGRVAFRKNFLDVLKNQ